jgi:hypothetical protein
MPVVSAAAVLVDLVQALILALLQLYTQAAAVAVALLLHQVTVLPAVQVHPALL